MTAAILAGTLDMGPNERLNISISFINRLSVGETLTGLATVTLTDESTDALYPEGLVGVATVSNPTVVQGVYRLVPGHKYLLNMSIDTNQTQTLQGQIAITCQGRPHQI